ncbi:MAG: biotin--[acetyl-CoA-carboxylase] ligase [Acidimicrobiia bacterium]|nr:biotin--[acetyl-CoA-carboxylase] ligase [Acidimicrobiia bacterium]
MVADSDFDEPASPTSIAVALERARPGLGVFGTPLFWREAIGSTNDLAGELASNGAAEGALVVADAQVAGRGRRGRAWRSPPGAGLYASIVLRPPPDVVPLLTLAAGVAIAAGVRDSTGVEPSLKWPNDVWVGDRKLAGVLAEAGASAEGVQHVVLGFGINLRAQRLAPEVDGLATSIEREAGRPPDRGDVLAACLVQLWQRYESLRRGERGALCSAWRAAAARWMGREVEWDEASGTRRGVAQDIDDSGALMVAGSAGPVRLVAGEVRWR